MKDVLMRRIAIFIPEGNQTVELITNNMVWSAAPIAELGRRRWLIETFFKLIEFTDKNFSWHNYTVNSIADTVKKGR